MMFFTLARTHVSHKEKQMKSREEARKILLDATFVCNHPHHLTQYTPFLCGTTLIVFHAFSSVFVCSQDLPDVSME